MNILLVLPARKLTRAIGEIHITRQSDIEAILRTDSLNPLTDGSITLNINHVTDNERDLNRLADQFIKANWWVCWCDPLLSHGGDV
jgi:hypothetical protein